MANVITSIRIICSIALIWCPALSPSFYALYLLAGFTDMIDGTVARKTNSVSELGSKLDSIADFIFIAVCLYKIIPVIDISVGIVIWIGIIALIKLFNYLAEYYRHGEMLAAHTVLNKVTGITLFVLPLTVNWIDFNIAAFIVCFVATVAALGETRYVYSS